MKNKIISYSIIILGIIFMYIGVHFGSENLIVLKKAIRICMECIGIG